MLIKDKKKFFNLGLFLVLFVSYFILGVANAGEQYLMETGVSKNETINIDKENLPISTKIWGGTESKIGDWPWMTALLHSYEADNYESQFCGGVLIGSSWILTAAHCAYGKSPNDIEVAIGAYDLSSPSINRIQVKSIHIHPQYNDTYLQNDIALLEINQSSSKPTIPIFAGESREGVPPSMLGEMTTAIGWGMADGYYDPYFPEKLRQVDLPIVASSYCDNIFGSPYLLSSQICAGYYEGKDACVGDSGGAIVSKVDNTWVHVGLVSSGTSCDITNGWYGKYTRTSSYIGFVKQYVPDVTVHPKASKKIAMPWLMLLLDSDVPEVPQSTCDIDHLILCTVEGSCLTAGGYWWSTNTCNSTYEPASTLTFKLDIDNSSYEYMYEGNVFPPPDGHLIHITGSSESYSYVKYYQGGDFRVASANLPPPNDGVSGRYYYLNNDGDYVFAESF